MNILKLLNANETAMVAAGQIYWAYLDPRRQKQPRYFVSGSAYNYTTLEGAQCYAKRHNLNHRRLYECASTREARDLATRHSGQRLITDMFKIGHN